MTAFAWRDVVARAEVPVILTCHNLLSDLTKLVGWLEAAGHERIILLDNASTYPPLLDYFAATPHEVVRLSENLGHEAPWLSALVDQLGATRPFVVSDPDVLPEASCPPDAAEYFQSLLLRHPQFDKAGFGLRIDDLPPQYPHRQEVRRWEEPYWQKEVADGVFAAHIDTTFAVHRPGIPYKVTESLRTGAPYTARHLPWYRDPRQPDAETAFFFGARRDDIGYWNRERLPTSVRAGADGE
jgi:hypothetical protein